MTRSETSVPAAGLAGYLQRIDRVLDTALPAAATDPVRLHEAMRYACRGGKRLRALLTYCAGAVLGGDPARLDAPACALELIHAYSLVHDDLPAMDDDDLRRGQPTVHKAYDEATAILVGDALQTLAFRVLAEPQAALGATAQVRMLQLLADAAGSLGMVGGQAVDIESEHQKIPLARLESLHARKTGALIRCGLLLAAAAAGATPAQEQALSEFGRLLGLAYQIQDDVLDESSSTAVLGKTQGKDRAQEKSTYPALLGFDAAQALAAETFAQARAALGLFGARAEPLLQLAATIEKRDH
ncbi:MAG: geranylgeranyl pyrophosphate synthase [Nevskia sp.]|nr:geranylgeranyl pyrophosphate synthase [Nevskia sp.]